MGLRLHQSLHRNSTFAPVLFRLSPVPQHERELVSARPAIYLARNESCSARPKKGDKCILDGYVSFMKERKARILLIDENPARLSSAATILIVSGYSVFPLNSLELFITLQRGNYDWQFDLVPIRASLDADTRNLFEMQLHRVPVRNLSRAATLDVNLPAIVDELLAATRPVTTHATEAAPAPFLRDVVSRIS